MKQPDYRIEELVQGSPPIGALEDEFIRFTKNENVSEEFKYAHDVYTDSYKSEVLEAFLLIDTDITAINKILKVPVPVIAIYKTLFFNRAIFRDELDIEAYVQTYPTNTDELKWGKELKQCAVTLGGDYLSFRFAHNSDGVDMPRALKTIIETAYVLSNSARLNALDSAISREARSWATIALKGIESYGKVIPELAESDDELNIALRTIEQTTNEKESQILVKDILH